MIEMDTSHKQQAHQTDQPHTKHTTHHSGHKKANVTDAANKLLHEGKKRANTFYKEANELYDEAGDSVKEYSDELLMRVKENPMAAVLIAAGVGFLISTILKK
jgi:ElaB/YqjD/DUF883 family membrane-anchored ribosome-binding protein